MEIQHFPQQFFRAFVSILFWKTLSTSCNNWNEVVQCSLKVSRIYCRCIACVCVCFFGVLTDVDLDITWVTGYIVRGMSARWILLFVRWNENRTFCTFQLTDIWDCYSLSDWKWDEILFRKHEHSCRHYQCQYWNGKEMKFNFNSNASSYCYDDTLFHSKCSIHFTMLYTQNTNESIEFPNPDVHHTQHIIRTHRCRTRFSIPLSFVFRAQTIDKGRRQRA